MKFKPGDIIVCVKPRIYGYGDSELKLKKGGYYKVKEYVSLSRLDKPTIHIIDFKGYGTDELYGYYEDRFEPSLKFERLTKLKKLNESWR